MRGANPTLKVAVVDNQIDAALKTLKKQMLRDGLFGEMKRRTAYEKPSVKRSANRPQLGKNGARRCGETEEEGERKNVGGPMSQTHGMPP